MKRPLGTLGIALALIVGVGVILLARWALWFGPGLPERDYAADFHTHALTVNGVTAEEAARGWAAWEAVVEAVIAADEAVSGRAARQPDGAIRLSAELNEAPEYRAASQPMLDALEQQGVRELLDQLAAAPAPVRPALEIMTLESAEDGKVARALARALAIELRESIAAGEADAAAQTVHRLHTLGRVMNGQPTQIERMLGQAIDAVTDRVVRQSLVAVRAVGASAAGEGAQPEMIEALLAALEARPAAPSVAETLEGERLVAIGMIAESLPERTGLPLRPISRGAQAAALDRAYEPAIEFAQRPGPARWGEVVDQPTLGRMDVMAAILVPAFDRFIVTADQLAMHRHATLLMLYIERHIAQTGAAPASLEELGLPPESLRDPWSGRAYGYRTLDGDPHGRLYLLWAVGANGVDDGGVEHPDGNDRALRDRETSADWIVNLPREVEG
jgi:hypothetical protein